MKSELKKTASTPDQVLSRLNILLFPYRFRVNDIACHPVLPLLLTTSHHNVLHNNPNDDISAGNDNFCSELILWRVDPVGPLSKSGGITELARINSQEISGNLILLFFVKSHFKNII